MRIILLFHILLFSFINISAQELTRFNTPKWVIMMDDPNVHYDDAVREFEAFWADRQLPVSEHDLFSADQSSKQDPDFVRQQMGKSDAETQQLAFAYKRFKRWQEKMKPFVRPDGRIMSPEERIQQWQAQRAGRQ
jgi:hypothetical protein